MEVHELVSALEPADTVIPDSARVLVVVHGIEYEVVGVRYEEHAVMENAVYLELDEGI